MLYTNNQIQNNHISSFKLETINLIANNLNLSVIHSQKVSPLFLLTVVERVCYPKVTKYLSLQGPQPDFRIAKDEVVVIILDRRPVRVVKVDAVVGQRHQHSAAMLLALAEKGRFGIGSDEPAE